jgi:DNA-binding beta-propeller fold protein YncE
VRFRVLLGVLAVACSSLCFASGAQAQRALLFSEAVESTARHPGGGVPGGGIEGACGIALQSGQIYVSDYYHHAIDIFGLPSLLEPGPYDSQIAFDSLDGPCQLAASSGSALYANDWHEGVARVLPSPLVFDEAESTGVAVDQATGNVYVDDRTYVAVYQPSGAPVLREGLPLRIGVGTLTDAYGIAVSEGKVYVPDAATKTIKVYEPALDPTSPAFAIEGKATPQKGFNSLIDASVAIDPTNGHLLVVDNLQPGFEAPEAAIDEFDGAGTFLGQLAKKVIDGGPSGLAFEANGKLYATTGNSEASQVLQFGPYSVGGLSLETERAEDTVNSPQGIAQSLAGKSAPPGVSDPTASASKHQGSEAVVIQRGGIKVSFDGKLAPTKLPREGSAPVRVSVAAKIAATDEEKNPPSLQRISIAINRYGHFDSAGLPICTERDIQPATTQNALKACKSSLVGVGTFSASVGLSRQSPFPAAGKMYAFNGRVDGKPAILAHVYGTKPVPTSFTFPFVIRQSKGTFGTTLVAKLPSTGKEGFITGLSMNLGRNYSFKGKRHSYLSASCPAPKGFSKASFSLAHADFKFKGGRSIESTLQRSCGVRG